MVRVPSGTVTFLFTDIAGSTRRWESDPEGMRAELARHDAILKQSIRGHGGFVFASGGDGFAAAFTRAGDALGCAAEVQQALLASACPSVRMAVHTGEVEERDGNYFGPAVNRAARLMAIGHGGQVLVSHATRQLAGDVALRDLGEHRLRDLSEPERVFQLVIPGQETDFPRLGSLDARLTNLPVQLTSFVGRDAELKAVGELLAAHRLVTLTGVGGVGKTRLAMQTAADAADHFRDGVWLVELASIDAQRIVDAIARVLGIEVRQGASVEASLLEFVGPRELLLVLDNCEHVVREVRRAGGELLRAAPGVSILTTSREGLRVPGEQLYSVPSLDEDAASQLFVDRACAVDAGFVLDESGEAIVAELCDRLDGVPLAIELAAARARMFSVADLARRVEQRFRLLTGGRGDVERHQTLRAAIDWSYDMLDESERRVFARLSVFAGGGTLDAIELVVGDDDGSAEMVVDLVAGLVDKSLVVADRTRAESRYEMLETIRQYAQERLVEFGEAEIVRERHARWFAEFARRAGRGLYSRDELAWDERLRPEVDNLQIAVAWAAGAGETDIAMRIGGAFPRQATTRPLLGLAHLAEIALRVTGADTHPAYARVLPEAAWAFISRGDRATAKEMLRESIDAQRGGARVAPAAFTYMLTIISWEEANYSTQVEVATEGLALAEASGNRIAATGLRSMYAIGLSLVDRPAEALPHAQHALDDARALQQPTLEISALYAVAYAKASSAPSEAIEMLRTAIELARQNKSESEEGPMLGLLAFLEGRHGDLRQSVQALRASAMARVRNPHVRWASYLYGSGVFLRVGRADLCALCEGKIGTLGGEWPLWKELHAQDLAEARTAMGDERFDDIAARGAAMESEEFTAMLVCEIDAIVEQLPDQPTT